MSDAGKKISRRGFMGAVGAAGLMGKASAFEPHTVADAPIPVLLGESKEVIPANPDNPGQKGWFTNDHCFIEDKTGRLHWFGINNPHPPEGKELYRYHPYLGHMSTTDPMGEWKRHDWALDESEGTEYLGAPAVVWVPDREKYAMVLETRLEDTRRLEVCWSSDLEEWERTYVPILPDDLWISTRDPQIMARPNGEFWIHLTTFGAKGVKQSQIIRLVTRDFVTFSGPEIVMGVDDCEWATLMESPFLVEAHGLWYLFFTYAHRRYTETPVVVSDDPWSFDFSENCVATLFGHASVVLEYRGKTYFSSCGPEDSSVLNTHGVTLCEFAWAKPV
jgi:hypothetical protein